MSNSLHFHFRELDPDYEIGEWIGVALHAADAPSHRRTGWNHYRMLVLHVSRDDAIRERSDHHIARQAAAQLYGNLQSSGKPAQRIVERNISEASLLLGRCVEVNRAFGPEDTAMRELDFIMTDLARVLHEIDIRGLGQQHRQL